MSKVPARSDVNERMLTEKAERVAEVMKVSHGAVSGWNVAEIKQQLTTALMALEAYPDSEQTHGLISLSRMPGNPHDYMVRLNLGVLMHFPEDEDPARGDKGGR